MVNLWTFVIVDGTTASVCNPLSDCTVLKYLQSDLLILRWLSTECKAYSATFFSSMVAYSTIALGFDAMGD